MSEGDEQRAGTEVEDRGEVGQIGHPVGPGGEEASAVAEGFACPDVEAAFAGILHSQREHAGGKWEEEADEREDPDYERAWAGGGRSGDPADAEDSDDVEEGEVAEAERMLEGVCGGQRSATGWNGRCREISQGSLRYAVCDRM
jgi:hypothetical protein